MGTILLVASQGGTLQCRGSNLTNRSSVTFFSLPNPPLATDFVGYMRDKPDFIGHKKFSLENIHQDAAPPINNFIVEPISDDDLWIKETTEKIGDWRAYFRSTYIRWALALNGLHIAKNRYESKIKEPVGFTIASLRADGLENIALWDMGTTAKNYGETIPMMAAWGLIDLFSCIEEFVFEFYRIFLSQHPDHIIRGQEFSDLRRLRREAPDSEEKSQQWEHALSERLDSWQRKRLYDGLSNVFLSYTSVAGLKTPSTYTLSTVETWGETIKGIGELRNCFTHGVETVTKELADFSAKPHSMFFDFKEGEPLQVELRHLQSVECFLDQLLTAINLSLIERAGYKLPAIT